MKLTDILKETATISELSGRNKKEVLGELCAALASQEQLDPEPLLKVLLEREKLGSTGIGDGIAIPHGKCEDITKILIAFGRSLEGIDFESLDGQPVHLFFLILAPGNSTGIHLKVLAKISRLLKDASFRKDLSAAAGSSEIYKIIASRDDEF
ncbi:MAG: PTS sugar transporter subunit IIA [Deltaproteobacteria bacterium]|nr:PTS sugar transporter subunit IIA [Deltaproteobacteria bacterium]MBW2052166.1 PTS sugar transporter subunit IIA [Deltaproteobacteria bacterium]MBW2139674.1 PTS sugar transporter subunit IIA [Deltaproteobacteria bacterium]MBW2322286.1 PTS sugar transporter subunit IIA [Deltaproteobacteria bacterium]